MTSEEKAKFATSIIREVRFRMWSDMLFLLGGLFALALFFYILGVNTGEIRLLPLLILAVGFCTIFGILCRTSPKRIW